MAQTLTYIYEAIDKFSSVAKRINNRIDQQQRKMKDLNRLSKSVRQVGGEMTKYLTLPTLAAGIASVATFAKYEQGLTRVGTLLGKSGFKEYNALLQEIMKNSIKQGFAIDDVSEAFFNSQSAMADINKSSEVMRQSIKMAVAGQITLTEATAAVNSVMGTYQLKMEDVSKVTNAFSIADDIGITTIGELAANFGKIGSVAKMAGVNFDELLASMAAMTLGGLSTDEATTALRATLSSLRSPGGETIRIFTKLGKQIGKELPKNLTQLKKIGLAETMLRLGEAMKVNENDFSAAITETRAFLGITSMTADKVDAVREAIGKMNQKITESSGLNEKYGMMANVTAHKLSMLWGRIKLLSIEIGERLAPYVIRLTNFLDRLIKKWDKLGEGTKKFLLISIAIVAILGPLLMIIGTLGLFISAIGAIPVAIMSIVPTIIIMGVMFVKTFKVVKNSIMGIVNDVISFINTIANFLKKIGLIKENIAPIFKGGNIDFKKSMQVSNIMSPLSGMQSGGEATIKVIAPRGTVETEKPKRKNGNFLNLGFNLQET